MVFREQHEFYTFITGKEKQLVHLVTRIQYIAHRQEDMNYTFSVCQSARSCESEMEITGREVRTVGRMDRKLPAVAP